MGLDVNAKGMPTNDTDYRCYIKANQSYGIHTTKSPHGLLVILTVDLASFCGNQSTKKCQLRSFLWCQVFEPEGPKYFIIFIIVCKTPFHKLDHNSNVCANYVSFCSDSHTFNLAN